MRAGRRCRGRRCRDRRCRDRRCRDRRCRDRRCRDVPAGASDMSTGRRMLLQRTDATAPPQADPLHTVFYQRLCAAPAYVHFEKQRTHLVGTSLHPLAGRQPKSRIRRQRQKPRCVQDSNAGSGDVGTYRQVRPTCQPAGGCIYKERMPLNLHGPAGAFPQKNLHGPPPLHTVFYQRLYAVPAYVHFEKQRTHLIGTSLHSFAGRQPESRIWRKRKKENTANVSLYVFNIF